MEQTIIPSKSSDLILLGATVFAYLTYLKNSDLKKHVKKLRKQNKEFRQQQQSASKEKESECTSIKSKLDETGPEDYEMREIGVITSPYPQRAGTPRQGLLAMNSRSILTLHDGISKECFDDLEQYSHVYIIFQFHLNPIGKGKDKNTIRGKGKQKKSSVQFTASKIKPPRANGKKVGVFATRSPHRPNNVGISIAKIEEVTTVSFVGENKKVKKKTVLKLKGLDLVDGTPVYDVKPYLPWDVVPTNELRAPSWVGQDDELSKVEWKEEAKESVQTYQKRGILAPLYPANKKKDNHKYDEEVIKAITEIVAQDPRSQHEGRGNATLDSSTFEITFCQLRVNFSVGIDKVAYIKKVLLDEGDVTAQPGSYQHSLGMRRKAEAHALKRGIKNLLWKFPVREGVLSDLYLLRDGTTYDFEYSRRKQVSRKNVGSFSLLTRQLVVPSSTKLYSREIMSNMDIMCLENAADICSYYDNCDLDEREALLNRFEEQTELMVDKVASMTALVKHLKTGDHKHLEDDEVATLRNNIFALLNNSLAH